MRPLHRTDPSSIDGYRLLGRLGAGGMGVVYLARSAGGALAALKLIRAEHAADPGFRARFRREARTAEQVTGRWVVRVLGADPEAHEPWLATEFVPGPSLAEAVALHGALPEPTVRALGARLADALDRVHTAGLVHRDVKPGNVLLALDGPRLIDFGIARVSGATALTATDAMIGTPGFLAPEQARATGAGEVGPAADVFSLGCVLAYALTGRRPFGTGAVAAVVYRTVHQEPDLGDDLPDTLLPLVTACLAKDPAERPTAAEVRAALGPYEGPAGDWLPPGLPALIAESSSRVLDLPVAEPTMAAGPGARRGTPRRRLLVLGAATAAAGAGVLAARLLNGGPAGGIPDPSGPRDTYTLGVLTDLSGPDRADGRAQERGARLAVEAFNARPDRPFDLAVETVDDGGDPARAAAGARRLAARPRLAFVIGPTTKDTAVAAGNELVPSVVPLASVVASVPRDDIKAQRSTRTYFELRPVTDVMIVPFGRLLSERGDVRTAIVEDREALQFSWLAVKSLTDNPPSARHGGRATAYPVAADSEDFGPAVRALLADRAQGVLYAGTSPRRAALCAKALRAHGFQGPRGGVDAAFRPEFLELAGPAAEGWYAGTGYVDPDGLPAARAFAAAYRKRWGPAAGTPVDRYATEAYDTTNWLIQVLTEVVTSGGGQARLGAGFAPLLKDAHYQGVGRRYGTEADTVQADALAGLFLWKVQGGRPRFLGPYDKAARQEASGSSKT